MTDTPRYPIGLTITGLTILDKHALQREGWDQREHVAVLELSDGSCLYPARDDEGNGPGVLFGSAPGARRRSSFRLIVNQ